MKTSPAWVILWLLPLSVGGVVFARTPHVDFKCPRSTSASSSSLVLPSTCVALGTRGGGGASPGNGNGSDAFQWRLSPLWTIVTKAVSEHVEPILKDPNGRLLTPLQNYVNRHRKVASEFYDANLPLKQENPTLVLSVAVFHPSRIVKISITAWVLAEVLHYVGFFEDPNNVGTKIRKAWNDARVAPIITTWQDRTQTWWKRARTQGGILHKSTWSHPDQLSAKFARLPPKYQFAVGTGLGMIVAPLVWSIANRLFTVGGIAYLLAEGNHFVRENNSGSSLVDQVAALGVKRQAIDKLESILESIRVTVRTTVQHPQGLLFDIQEVLDEKVPHARTIPASAKQGLALGLVAGLALVG